MSRQNSGQHIYTIICLKSVDVRRLQVEILARSPREMSQTDRILPRYFLSRVRVSVRPRIFYTRKNSQTTVGPITDRPRHRPSERRNNLKGILYLHARWRLTSQFTQMVTDDFVAAPKPPQSKRKAIRAATAKRGSVCADAGLHSQVICTCVSLKFIQITGNS